MTKPLDLGEHICHVQCRMGRVVRAHRHTRESRASRPTDFPAFGLRAGGGRVVVVQNGLECWLFVMVRISHRIGYPSPPRMRRFHKPADRPPLSTHIDTRIPTIKRAGSRDDIDSMYNRAP
ncbi:hypothetical protein NUV26_04920 [Burkholderia pseudomultivorans]|uniref:hypothetical protein n=1 Tax=Burkholderia pseudomultivorans TaxID=1207504 RepID=UPI002876798A|nr:hypothetical protein [Burkholderia pseudomultivorans]MDS0791487.1 hypothetical protein [Burkholderia pseudomultivorans]